MNKEIIELEDTVIIDYENQDPVILNETATEIYYLIKKEKTTKEIIDFIFKNYEISMVNEKEVIKDITSTVNEIKNLLRR